MLLMLFGPFVLLSLANKNLLILLFSGINQSKNGASRKRKEFMQ